MDISEQSALLESDRTDDELAVAAQTNGEAFAILYRRYVDRVFRYVMNRVQNKSLAEDVTSKIFLDVLDSLDRYQPKGKFPAWLFTIARRRCADLYRQEIELPLFEDGQEGSMEAPEEGALAGDKLRRLDSLLARLTSEERELLRLRYAGDLSFSEIGQVMGKSEDATKMAASRLIRRLRALWEVEDGQSV